MYGNESFTIITVPDDRSSINSAISAVPNGGIVRIKGGTYTENVYINKSVTLEGENNPRILSPLMVDSVQNVIIKGIRFEIYPYGTEAALTVYNVKGLVLERLTFKGSSILLVNSTNIVVKGCRFEDNLGPSISIRGSGSGNITIEWCQFILAYSALLVRQGSDIIFRYNDVNTTSEPIKLYNQCVNTLVYLNNFYYGVAEDNGIDNKWFNGTIKLGNYWAKLVSANDRDGDRILDEPIKILGLSQTLDMYPLMEPFTEYINNQTWPATFISLISLMAVAIIVFISLLEYRRRCRKRYESKS
ncbi:MAG: NosD domain-containing protein [Nitrososphaeria archaeon]